jgi:hypothetical protein
MTSLDPYIRQCRSCEADIIWARTVTGRRMPVDADPDVGGTVQLEVIQGFVRATVHTPTAETVRQGLHHSHFSTCPDADEWRKRRGAL